jgi:hypothetical protein
MGKEQKIVKQTAQTHVNICLLATRFTLVSCWAYSSTL